MPKTLGIWEWGCPKRGDAQNAVTATREPRVQGTEGGSEVWKLLAELSHIKRT